MDAKNIWLTKCTFPIFLILIGWKLLLDFKPEERYRWKLINNKDSAVINRHYLTGIT